MTKLISLFCFLSIQYLQAQSSNVLFGERDLNNKRLSLYFDKQGHLYPDYYIADTSLERANASLNEWYSNNQQQFIKIAAIYNCRFNTYSTDNCRVLNDSILSANLRKINGTKTEDNNSVTLMIHGFRKPYKTINHDRTSPTDFKTMEEAINKYMPSKSTLIEVYWDGLYGCCFSTDFKENDRLFHIFEASQINAEKVGNSLKKVIANINQDTVTIITHSLGAKVAVYSLFNINTDNAKTPSNKRVNLCIVAPAISGDLIKDNFYKRNSTVAFKKSDNYHLYIVYNENDFVLLKKDNKIGLVGPGPYKYGNTTLGCNYEKSALKLQKFFIETYPASSIKLFDAGNVGKCHLVHCYFNSNNLETMLKGLNK